MPDTSSGFNGIEIQPICSLAPDIPVKSESKLPKGLLLELGLWIPAILLLGIFLTPRTPQMAPYIVTQYKSTPPPAMPPATPPIQPKSIAKHKTVKNNVVPPTEILAKESEQKKENILGKEVRALPNTTPLRVSENQIVYKNNPITIYGISVGDVADLQYTDYKSRYKEIAQEWNANTVRMSVHPSTWTEHPERTIEQLKEHVKIATEKNLFVIIDYHVIGWPDGYYQTHFDEEPGKYIDDYNSDFETAQNFWRTVSKTINQHNVMFELWNEAVYEKDTKELPKNSRWPELKSYYEILIKNIRENDNDSIVLVSGGSWAYNLQGIGNNLIEDTQAAYTWHIYAGAGNNSRKAWESALDKLYTIKPVIVAEWGFDPDDDENHWHGSEEDFGNTFRDDFIEKKGLGNVAWCLHPDYGPALTKSDWKTPTKWGKFVKEYFASHNTQESPDFIQQ
jgi:endoglucanase